MGYVDCDAHVREPDGCWDYLDPGERHLGLEKSEEGAWIVDGLPAVRPFDVTLMPPEYNELFPEGSVDLADPSARLARLDVLGIDVQALYSTFWLNIEVASPEQEAALMRSWNRWMGERVADAGGRLVWNIEVPFRLTERALAEMEYGKAHGAGGVHLCGLRYGATVTDPAYRPIFDKAQELDLVVSVHVGGDWRKYVSNPSAVLLNNLAPVASALHALQGSGLPAEYPGVRWAFVEAGASWLPFAVQEACRADAWGAYRTVKNWRDLAATVLADNNFYVTCLIDDDLPYLCSLFGATNLVYGTDYSHMDLGSDPYGLNVLAAHDGLTRDDARAIADVNGRRLWGIDPTFTPAPAPVSFAELLDAPLAWTN